MAIQRKAGALATAALLLAAMTACAGSGNEPSSSATPTTTSRSPAITNSMPPSESEIASEAASHVVRRFYAVRNQLGQNHEQPLSQLEAVAISVELNAQQNRFKRDRRHGLNQVGDTKLAELTVQSVSLDNSDAKAGKVPTVQVDVCFDVSGVDVVDADGKSVVRSDRPDTGWIRYSVANYEWESDPAGAWRVASSKSLERTPCAP